MSHAKVLEDYLKELRNPAPSTLDPEEENRDETSAQIRYSATKDEEEIASEKIQFGSLRKRTHLVSDDPKYSGKAVSRKELGLERLKATESNDAGSDSEAFSGEEDFSGSDLGDSVNDDQDSADVDDDIDVSPDYGSNDEEDGNEMENDDSADDETEVSSNFKAFSSADQGDSVDKGKSVRCQLELWDKLVESRIHLQKLLSISNKLPKSDCHALFKSAGGPNLAKQLDKSKASLFVLLGKLLEFQQRLLAQDENAQDLLKNGDKPESSKKNAEDSDEEIYSNTEEENSDIESKDEGKEERARKKPEPAQISSKRKHIANINELSEQISKRHKAYAPYRDSVISKWNEKTKFSSGKANSKSFSSFDKPTLLQIKHVLGDEDRLLKRTQLKRSTYQILGDDIPGDEKSAEDLTDSHLKATDCEIFDDDDFYHQLLKELIERKSSAGPSDDPLTIGRQWLQLQRLRSKVKRKIDTKASKGRRVRYEVHSKLVSFMSPIEVGTMRDQARNDLFNSLFGRDPNNTESSTHVEIR